MKVFRYIAVATILVGVLAPPMLARGRTPGSVLIFTVQRSGSDYFTLIGISNTNTNKITPNSFGGSTTLHYEYANAVPNNNTLDPTRFFHPLNCTVFNRFEFLTPADHLSVVTSCHNAVSPSGQEGYLVVSAEDPTLDEVPWSHNDLIGSELVINSSGGMYGLNAISLKSNRPRGRPTDTNPQNGRLDFNDLEYEAVPDVLYIDAFIALAESHLAVINLTGGPRDINTIQLTVWNDNEFPLSQGRPFNCWFDQPLSRVAPLFEETFLANLQQNDPNEVSLTCNTSNIVETGWARLDSLGVETPGGLFVSDDGAMLGSISAGKTSLIDGGHLLWESDATQSNGQLFTP